MLLIDTNVLIDVLEDDPDWAEWSLAQLRSQSQIHALAINPIVYAELSLAFKRIEELERIVENMQLEFLETPRPALYLASKAFSRRAMGGNRSSNNMRDLLLGAHAAVCGMPLLTRSPLSYSTHFPSLRILSPPDHYADVPKTLSVAGGGFG